MHVNLTYVSFWRLTCLAKRLKLLQFLHLLFFFGSVRSLGVRPFFTETSTGVHTRLSFDKINLCMYVHVVAHAYLPRYAVLAHCYVPTDVP